MFFSIAEQTTPDGLTFRVNRADTAKVELVLADGSIHQFARNGLFTTTVPAPTEAEEINAEKKAVTDKTAAAVGAAAVDSAKPSYDPGAGKYPPA